MTLFGASSEIDRWADISDDGRYRYTLTRRWDDRPRVVFVMLNPSTADADIDDPTIRRCIGFARRWDFGGIEVVNLFAWRATDPVELARADDPVGPDNDDHIVARCAGEFVVAAWGASVPYLQRRRPADVLAMARNVGGQVHHLGLTKDGSPRHPLYLRGDTEPTRWSE